jgi:hypothetical protein
MDDVRHTSSPEYKKAAGDSMAFRRAANILDMALAAAKQFFNQVRHRIVFCDTGRPITQVNLGSVDDWDIKHPGYLQKAEDCYRLLEAQGRSSKNERFKEWLNRLMQKISDGHRIGSVPSY